MLTPSRQTAVTVAKNLQKQRQFFGGEIGPQGRGKFELGSYRQGRGVKHVSGVPFYVSKPVALIQSQATQTRSQATAQTLPWDARVSCGQRFGFSFGNQMTIKL